MNSICQFATFCGLHLLGGKFISTCMMFFGGAIFCSQASSQEVMRPEWDSLIAMGKRYEMTFPDPSARLALIHSESWRVVGNRSHPHDPAEYHPGWVLGQREDQSLRVLVGLNKESLILREQREPLHREFSLTEPPLKIGGYVVDFNEGSTFVVAIQCAHRGDRERADALWDKFTKNERFSFVLSGMRDRKGKASPSILFGAILFEHLEWEIQEPGSDIASIARKMDALLKEIPSLVDDRRKTLLVAVQMTANAKPAVAGSVEAMLVEWGMKGDKDAVRDEESIPQKLIERGFEVIPELLLLQNDQRLTRMGYDTMMSQYVSTRPLGDLAHDLLSELLPDAQKLVLRNDGPDGGKFAKAWQKSQALGEKNYYLSQVWHRDEKGKFDYRDGALSVIAKKFPDQLVGLVEKFQREAMLHSECRGLASAIFRSALSTESKTELLLTLAKKGGISCRAVATRTIALINHEAAKAPALAIVRSLPKDTEDPYCGSAVGYVSHLVLAIDDDEVWQEFFRAARRAKVGLRLEWMNPFSYSYLQDRLQARRLAFLAAFLDDTTLRDDEINAKKFDGPCAAFTFPKITVRDFSAMQIASILDISPLDSPDSTWTAKRWEELRSKVKARLLKDGIQAMKL